MTDDPVTVDANAGRTELHPDARAQSNLRVERTEGPEVDEVFDVSIPGPEEPIPLRVYRPSGEGARGVVVYFHLSGLPPASVLTYGFDPLRDEGVAYASRLAAAGVPVRHHHLPDQIHGFVGIFVEPMCSHAEDAFATMLDDLPELEDR